jgi:stage V sporulation protein B
MVKDRLVEGAKFADEYATELYGQLTGKYVSITTLPVAISAAMATASIPAIAASMAVKDVKTARQKVNTMFRLAMMLSIPSAVGIGVLGVQIIHMLFPSFTGGGELLNIGFISIIFLAAAQLSAGILQSLGKVRIPMYAALVGALIKIPLNYYLIAMPDINIKGAVISTIACNAVVAVIDMVALAHAGILPDLTGGLVKPLIAAGIMGLGCFVFYHFFYGFVPNNTFCVLVAIIIGVGIYFGILLLIKGIDREDLRSAPMGYRLEALLDRFL